MKVKKLRKSLVVSLMGDQPQDTETNLPMPLLLAKKELELLWRTTPLNRYFLPISQMPRPKVPGEDGYYDGTEPPRCCPKAGTPRARRPPRADGTREGSPFWHPWVLASWALGSCELVKQVFK
eukprot:symbB.v1.2.009328.t1/scaffold588.1/size186386/5